MLIQNLLNLLTSYFQEKKFLLKRYFWKVRNNPVRIAFITSGGLGDHLLICNHVWYLKQKFFKENDSKDIIFIMVFRDKYALAKHIVSKDLVQRCYNWKRYKREKHSFDLVMSLEGFPDILFLDKSRFEFNPLLLDYLEKCEEYKRYAKRNFRGNLYGTMKLCELEGRKLIQRSDIGGLLNIVEDYKYKLPYPDNEEKILTEFNLKNKIFITIQTGCDNVYTSHVKLWGIQKYRELVSLILEQYPFISVVQVGNSGELIFDDGEQLSFVQLNNKTSIPEVMVLLRNSLLHIGIEGGLVHLRHALCNRPSIVLFGPTSVFYFGYTNNINVVTDACMVPCYQLTNSWPTECPRTQGKSLCMESISVDKVWSIVQNFILNFVKIDTAN